MTFEMTQPEARALAAYLALVRHRSGGPEWHKAGIEDALGKARHLAPSPDLAIAAIKAAREPSNRTPAVIGMEGPHWQAAAIAPHRPYDQHATCAGCGLSEPECRRRWPDDHEFESVQAAKVRRARQRLDTKRAADALKELTHAEPEPRPEPPRSTAGTEHVAPIRAALAGGAGS